MTLRSQRQRTPSGLQMKMARICRMPEHVRYALITQIASGVPALAMIPDDDLIEAIKCLNKSYLRELGKDRAEHRTAHHRSGDDCRAVDGTRR